MCVTEPRSPVSLQNTCGGGSLLGLLSHTVDFDLQIKTRTCCCQGKNGFEPWVIILFFSFFLGREGGRGVEGTESLAELKLGGI